MLREVGRGGACTTGLWCSGVVPLNAIWCNIDTGIHPFRGGCKKGDSYLNSFDATSGHTTFTNYCSRVQQAGIFQGPNCFLNGSEEMALLRKQSNIYYAVKGFNIQYPDMDK